MNHLRSSKTIFWGRARCPQCNLSFEGAEYDRRDLLKGPINFECPKQTCGAEFSIVADESELFRVTNAVAAYKIAEKLQLELRANITYLENFYTERVNAYWSER